MPLRINPARLRADFDALARIGAAGVGVHRPALSANHLAARAWLRERILAAGLEFRQDAAGNHSGILRAASPAARTLLLGSHTDSVPHGGRFDGALGVLAALEALRTVQDASLELPVHLEAIDFTDEEGALVGLLGSRALTGALTPGELAQPRGGLAALRDGFARAGITDPLGAARPPGSLAGFLELHIEQGPRLIEAGADIGIVSAIVGIGSFRLAFGGRADHAGTTPMHARRDAGRGAAEFMVRARGLVTRDFPGCVINFGRAAFEPGAYNIVPERAELALEFRSPVQAELDALEAALLGEARRVAAACHLELEAVKQGCVAPAPCAPEARAAFAAAADDLGLRHIPLVSGAGHDTQALAAVCPAGMIFIPSTGGSHNPGEFAEWEACVNGANVLLGAAIGWLDR
jgi:N-carbamoyl-L-amino-acid hydrolase